VWEQCPAGPFNPTAGSNSLADCQLCAAGTYNPSTGATKATACRPCRAGTYSDITGVDMCRDCAPGTSSASGSTTCTPCRSGHYAANRALGECATCPFPLSSGPASVACDICRAGYYLANPSVGNAAGMLEQPDQYCPKCPLHAECPFNTTLATLVVPPNFWRGSLASASLYWCNSTAGGSECRGSIYSAYKIDNTDEGRYCSDGYSTGPRCEDCTTAETNHYFAKNTRRCEVCPGLWRLAVLFVVGLVVVTLIMTLYYFASRSTAARRRMIRLSAVAATLSLQAKFKIMVGFVQVITVLGSVYGVHLDSRFTGWLEALDFLNFDFIDLTVPSICLGSMRRRLVLNALWPHFATLLVISVIGVQVVFSRYRTAAPQKKWVTLRTTVFKRSLYIAILIFYLVLPSVSRSIFKARQCVSYSKRRRIRPRQAAQLPDRRPLPQVQH